jgi:non-ribosomal peptide synthetase component F
MPSVNLKAIANLSHEDQKLFVQYGFGSEMAAPFGCVHHAFAYHAASQPSATAVEHLGDTVTYGDLDIKSSRLARKLQSSDVRQGSRIVLLAERSIPFVIAILAILKAGAAYVPLDGGIVTDSTLGHVITDSEATLTIAMKAYTHRPKTGRVLCLEDAIEESESTELASEPLVASKPTDGVYVIYTSGTTGKPKGVDVMHYNVTNCKSKNNLSIIRSLTRFKQWFAFHLAISA